jgi:plasmid replication initiation protein
MTTEDKEEKGKIVPLFGKDEMNLIEFPFGPIRSSKKIKTFEVEHQAFDRILKREVTRQLIMTGSDKWGLPRPIDDQVLLAMKKLTHDAGFTSQKVDFSRYQLCRAVGWSGDGRTYKRIEQSLDRIAGTTFKFKDAWWDNGEKQYKSKTFHLITDVEICSRDQLDRSRIMTGRTEQQLCSFTWTDVMWKSFQDGFIRTLDMQLFGKIAQGRRREVPLRLFRILDKRFYHSQVASFDLHRLCIGTIGLCPDYSPSQVTRVLDRAAKWLIECGYLEEFWYTGRGWNIEVFFRKRFASVRLRKQSTDKNRRYANTLVEQPPVEVREDSLKTWLSQHSEGDLHRWETEALENSFGSELERTIIVKEREKNVSVLNGGRIRQEFMRRYKTVINLKDANSA